MKLPSFKPTKTKRRVGRKVWNAKDKLKPLPDGRYLIHCFHESRLGFSIASYKLMSAKDKVIKTFRDIGSPQFSKEESDELNALLQDARVFKESLKKVAKKLKNSV